MNYGLPPFQTISGWQISRFGLIWVSFLIAIVLAFFTLLTALDWFTILLGVGETSLALIISTILVLIFANPLYSWILELIDTIFFPDTASLKKNVIDACRVLTNIDALYDLEHFLERRLPPNIQVEYVYLSENPEVDAPGSLKLPLQMGDRPLGILLIGPKRSGRSFSLEELTTLEQLQEQVSLVLSVVNLNRARDEAEHIDDLKNLFLTNISHQLRTPLNTVINTTGLVADGEFGPVSAEHQEFLNRAIHGSEYLMSLLNDILDITKIETGELTLNHSILHIEEVIQDITPLVRGMLWNKPVELKVTIAEGLPVLIADRLRLRQVLLNLLSNAIKFTKEGSIYIEVWQEGKWLKLSVEDTGIGIEQADIPLIFQDFHQVIRRRDRFEGNGTERYRFTGTGLGMPITRALIELQGGTIEVQSVPGQGSTFTVSLPISVEVQVGQK